MTEGRLGVSVSFRGNHTEAPREYRHLLEYIKENDLLIAGDAREVTIIDYGLTNDQKKFVTEIKIPVGKK